MGPIERAKLNGTNAHTTEVPDSGSVENMKISNQLVRNILKAKEAEDRPVVRKITRQKSAPLLLKGGISLSEQQEIAKKSGEVWGCIGRKPNKLGGYIYQFRLKDEFNLFIPANRESSLKNLNNKLEEMFPATEPSIFDIFHLKSMKPKHESRVKTLLAKRLYQQILSSYPERVQSLKEFQLSIQSYTSSVAELMVETGKKLTQIGYRHLFKDEKVFLELPDRVALMANWETLRAQDSNLPPIDIIPSDGIADDLAFAEAYFIHDALLSSDKEFLHDQISHVLPTLSQILHSSKNGNQTYQQNRARMFKLVASVYKKVIIAKQELKSEYSLLKILELSGEIAKFEVAAGALTDSLSASYILPNELFEDDEAFDVFSIWVDPNWKMYMERRFGEDWNSKLTLTWKLLTVM